MKMADSRAGQGHATSLNCADTDTGIGSRVMYTLLAAIWVALVASPAFADRYYTWNANVPGGPIYGGGSSGGTKYYTYEEALNALKAFSWKGGLFWQNADPSLSWDLNPVYNSLVPHRGYWDTRQTLRPTPTETCSAAPFYPTCTYVAPPERFAPASFNDVWTCKGVCQSSAGPYVAPLGQVHPYCGDFPGYSWSEYGNLNYYQQVAPSGTCYSAYAGAINAVEFDPKKSCDEPCLGNPINPALGTKTHRESIVRTADASQALAFEWLYSSHMLTTKVKRAGWSHTYSRLIVVAPGTTPANMKVNVFRETGVIIAFNLSAGQYAASGDIAHKLARLDDGTGNTTGWTFTNAANDEVETYDGGGRLVAIRTRAGATQTISYSTASTPPGIAPEPGLPIGVTDSYGRSLAFTYDAMKRLRTLVDPAGFSYGFTFDTLGNLTTIAYPDGTTRTFLYENGTYTGALTGIVDENAVRFASYGYDAHGRAISTQHAGGVQRYDVVFNTDGSSTVTDPLGTVRTLTFASVLGAVKGSGVSQSCTTCGVLNFKASTYDAQGNVSSRTDFNNSKVCYAYDLTRKLETARIEGALASENCATVLANPPSRADVRRVTTAWNATWRLPASITEPAPGGARTTTFSYDAFGNLLQKSTVAPKNDGSGGTLTRTWNWTYGTLGRVTTATDPNGNVATHAYFPDNDSSPGRRGNLQSVTNPLGHVTQIGAYDANGRPLTMIDPNDLTTILTYDARGRLIDRNVGGEQTTYSYDGVGQLTLVTMPDFSTLAYTYDAAHRLTQIQDGLGNRIVYTLDAIGNRTREQAFDQGNVLARTRARAYDALNRLAQEIGAQVQTTSYAYDNSGNLTSTSDPLRHVTGNTYDALNRLVQVLDPAGGVTRYAYDGANNLAQVTDPRGLATVYVYDGLNNLAKLASPDTGTTASTFDPAGNLLTRVDARGVTSTYTMDALNRVATVVHSSTGTPSEMQTYTYDSGANARGRLTRLDDTAASTTWTYTLRGRVASKTQTTGSIVRTLAYGYNAAGQLASLTTPSGQVIAYGYANNRVTSVSVNGSTLVTGIATAPFGPAEGWQWGNAEFTFRRYDPDGRLASWEFRNGRSVLRNDLDFDTAGRITAVSDPNFPANSAAYQYDDLDRLAVAQLGNPVAHTQQFAYDALGNRQNATSDGNPVDLYYAANSNQLRQMIGFVSPSYLSGATALTFAYNNANRMVRTQSSGVTLATYAVNGMGQRVQKTVGSTTTVFVYDEQGRLVGEYDGAGKLIQETVWLDDLPIATLRPTGIAGTPTPIDVYYVHADHLGSPRAVTRPSDNAIMWRWDNADPFGANAANENPAGQGTFQYGLRFPGQYYDAETATHYNYFRDYDPGIGRYVQSDPIGLLGGPNAFRYAKDSPVAIADRLGLMGSRGNSHAFDGCGPNGQVLEWIIPDNWIFKFGTCCDNHDNCYADCKNMPTKESCDSTFCGCLLSGCLRYAHGQKSQCETLAGVYCWAVRKHGDGAFDDSRRTCQGRCN